jgi:hypothetical protein
MVRSETVRSPVLPPGMPKLRGTPISLLGWVQGTSGIVLKDSTLQGNTVLKDSTLQGKTALKDSTLQGKTALKDSTLQGKTALKDSTLQGKTGGFVT